MKIILTIYDYLKEHRILCFSSLFVIIGLLIALVFRIDYKEDITDFLPVDQDYHESMKTYQDIVASNKIVLLFSQKDTTNINKKKITDGVEQFGKILEELDTANWIKEYEPRVDIGLITDIFEHVYSHLPYYLSEDDYNRIEEVISNPEMIREKLLSVKGQISSPIGSLFEPMFVYDPLGFGDNIANLLKDFQPESRYKQFNGYIFTEDEKKCLVSITSPFGGSETNMNGRLLDLLDKAREELSNDGINVSFIGSPVIAVNNASQIKHDTIIAVIISVVLILGLLLYSFRNLRSLFLIAITTSFGFIFALGCIGIFRESISLIVIGIASIIIGIAVNYPLHYVCHLKEHDHRNTIKDLVAPLLIGNITTVGAFLTLVPLEAVAIRDLGLFSALMLVGTILFVLIFLPQINIVKTSVVIKDNTNPNSYVNNLFSKLTTSKISLIIIIIITVIFGVFSLKTEFDSNMNHINYMTDEQRIGMENLASMRGENNGTIVYITSTAEIFDDASSGIERIEERINNWLKNGDIVSSKNPVRLLPSSKTQERNLKLWKDFWSKHNLTVFKAIAKEEDFTAEAFQPFYELTTSEFANYLSWEDNELLIHSIFTGFVGSNSIVEQLVAKEDYAEIIEKEISSITDSPSIIHAFDLTSLNGRIANTLSSDFNYIGFACSLIVFLFLWISFGRIELAIVAFLPMAIGWLWILGIMQICGISFNIVNIILATFIFGQGDDYTIFITEGLIKDYKDGSKILVSYQNSIILSALIMLIGIGSLIFAKHPAMHSLAEVTIIGMLVVVFMAWIIPPIAFNLFIKYDKSLREYLSKNKK